MSKVQGYPHKQGFNVTPRKNLTKKSAWWQADKSNNPRQAKKED